MTGLQVCLTVDVEPDCPPFLWTWRGMEEGLPRLLDVFAEESVPGTFFTTGDAARRFPDRIGRIAAEGHELACHGFWHKPFRAMRREEARAEVADTNEILRRFAPVTSFRAPFLSFPEGFLDMLPSEGITLDASRAAYKPMEKEAASPQPGFTRLRASVTSSVLRLPARLRDPWLLACKSPVVLFVHPWEFVDLRRTDIRWDCRFRTGDTALRCFRSAIRLFKARGAEFRTARALAAALPRANR